jgi:hypothetical protein
MKLLFLPTRDTSEFIHVGMLMALRTQERFDLYTLPGIVMAMKSAELGVTSNAYSFWWGNLLESGHLKHGRLDGS